jgi:hypothetical protein
MSGRFPGFERLVGDGSAGSFSHFGHRRAPREVLDGCVRPAARLAVTVEGVAEGGAVSHRDCQWVERRMLGSVSGQPGTLAEHRRRRHRSPAPLTRSERGATVV